MRKCNICKHYNTEKDTCTYCQFTYHPQYTNDNWDILNLNENQEYLHKQIQYRLQTKNIDTIKTDIYPNNNIAYLIGCYTPPTQIAEALNLHPQVIYGNNEDGIIIINLYQEKQIRQKKQEKNKH